MPNKKSKVTKKPAKKTKKTPKVVTPVVPTPAPVPAPPPAPPAPPAPPKPVRSEADAIWDQIKNLPIQMFGLPDQFVLQHCTPIPVEPSNLYVSIRSTATLPSLEAAIAPAFVVELADKFVIIKRAPRPIVPTKQR